MGARRDSGVANSMNPAPHGAPKTAGTCGTRLRRHHMMIVIQRPWQSFRGSARAQAVLLARFFGLRSFVMAGSYSAGPAQPCNALAGEQLRAEPHHSPNAVDRKVTRGRKKAQEAGAIELTLWPRMYKYTVRCIRHSRMSATKTFRHGQILAWFPANTSPIRKNSVTASPSKSCADQATLPRFAGIEARQNKRGLQVWLRSAGRSRHRSPAYPRTPRIPVDIRPAQNLLVLKTPPSGAQPLAAASTAQNSRIAGTIAGDDTFSSLPQPQKPGISPKKSKHR